MSLIGLLVGWTCLRKQISEIEAISTETPKLKFRRKTGKKIEYSKNFGKIIKDEAHIMGIPEGGEKER